MPPWSVFSMSKGYFAIWNLQLSLWNIQSARSCGERKMRLWKLSSLLRSLNTTTLLLPCTWLCGPEPACCCRHCQSHCEYQGITVAGGWERELVVQCWGLSPGLVYAGQARSHSTPRPQSRPSRHLNPYCDNDITDGGTKLALVVCLSLPSL